VTGAHVAATGCFGRENDQSLVDAPDIYFEAGDHQALVHVWQRVSQVNGQRAARPDQSSRVAIEQSKGIRRALRVEAVQMHSVLIVATVDRGHGDSVGRQVGGVPWEQPKVLVVFRSAPIVACSRA
jgi:hypothetical protein